MIPTYAIWLCACTVLGSLVGYFQWKRSNCEHPKPKTVVTYAVTGIFVWMLAMQTAPAMGMWEVPLFWVFTAEFAVAGFAQQAIVGRLRETVAKRWG